MDIFSVGSVLERYLRPLIKNIDPILVYLWYILVFYEYPLQSAV